MTSKAHICLINRNYPPIRGATGYYASHLVDYLRSQGYQVTIVSTGDSSTLEHIQIRSQYEGKVKWRRMFSSYFESRKLIQNALRIQANVYIVMSDPPFLNYWAARLLKREKWMYWSMDVFPAAFVANGLISETNVFARHITQQLSDSPPSHIISLGARQTNYLRDQFGWKDIGATIIPIGYQDTDDPSTDTHSDPIFGYVGTIGEAHDLELLVQVIDRIDQLGHRIIVRAMGAKADLFLSQIRGKRHVEIHDYVSDELMAAIDVQLVTLQPHWTHISVPSKALTAICNSSAVLYLGNEESDTWQYIREAAWRISSEASIDQVLHFRFTEEIRLKQKRTSAIRESLSKHVHEGYAEIDHWLSSQSL